MKVNKRLIPKPMEVGVTIELMEYEARLLKTFLGHITLRDDELTIAHILGKKQKIEVNELCYLLHRDLSELGVQNAGN